MLKIEFLIMQFRISSSLKETKKLNFMQIAYFGMVHVRCAMVCGSVAIASIPLL